MIPLEPESTPKRFWRRPDPCVGLAIAAVTGILIAEWSHLAPRTALAWCLIVWLIWAWRRQPAVFWAGVAVAFGTLHLFTINGVPAATLARLLPSNPNDPSLSVRATGTVLDEPRFSATGITARFTFGLDRVEVAGHAWTSQSQVLVQWQHGTPLRGDRLEIIGTASNIAAPRNPGEFDFADYERRQSIRSQIRCSGVTDVRILSREGAHRPGRLAVLFHDWMRDTLHAGLAPGAPAGAIISTMLLGLREDPGLGPLEDLFQRTGTLHYFAIDGLKLALLSCLILWVLTRAGVPRLWAMTFSLPPLVFYVVATGLGPASLRAAVTAAILLLAFWIERPVRQLNTWGAGAAGILLCDTNQLFDLGYQLTFGVVLALILFAGPLHRTLLRIGAPDPFLPHRLYSRARRAGEVARTWAWGLVSVSLVAWAGSLPVMVLRFHVVSPISPLANIATFPLAWLVLTLGVAALTAAPLAALINHVNALAAAAFLGVAQMFDAVPAGSFYVPAPAEWSLCGSPTAEINVLDLGKTRATHLRAGNADWLIDAAQPIEYTRSVLPYLHARGVNRLAGLILSQADRRHLGGASLAVVDFHIPRIIDTTADSGRSSRRRELLEFLEGRKQRLEIVNSDSRLALRPGVELRVLYPPPGLKSGAAADRAMVLQLRAAGWRVLLMGDAEVDTERWLLAHVAPADLRSDVIVTGSPAPEGAEFARVAAPRLVISQQVNLPTRAINQSVSGAVRLRLFADRLEATGFVDSAQVTLTP